MNKTARIVIVVLLLAAVWLVVALKQKAKDAPADVQPPAAQTQSLAADLEQENETAKARLPLLVDLGAGKCQACKMMEPVLEELRTEYAGKMEVKFVDVWQSPDQAKPYNVKLIPTQIFYSPAGDELFRHEGFFSKEDILAKWREFGFELQKDVN